MMEYSCEFFQEKKKPAFQNDVDTYSVVAVHPFSSMLCS